MYKKYVEGYEVYYSEGSWFVEDEFGWTPYNTYNDCLQAIAEDTNKKVSELDIWE